VLLWQQATWSHCHRWICFAVLNLCHLCNLVVRSFHCCFLWFHFGTSVEYTELSPLWLSRPWTLTMARQRSPWNRRHGLLHLCCQHRLPGVSSDAMPCASGNELQVTATAQHPISLHILRANKVLQLVDEIW